MPRFRARLALIAAFVIASLGSSIGAASVAGVSYLSPSWWGGSVCDASHWNSVASSLGWDVTANPAHALGASYLGVPVCGPRPSWDKQGTKTAPNVGWTRSGWVEYEWQCVELSFRFMAQIYGVKAYGANGWNVVTNYKTAYGGGLTKIANGTVGASPQPGDIIQFGTVSPGHTVVVAANAVDANGNGTITVMSQNDAGSTTGWRTISVSAWKVAAVGGQAATKWLHQNVVTFDGLDVGTIVTSQFKGQGMMFGGYNPFGTAQSTRIHSVDATSPARVLSGTPAWEGGVKGWFVVPGTTTKTTVGTVRLDIGRLTVANSIKVVFYDATGAAIKSVVISTTGTYKASVTGSVASFRVFEVAAGVGTFSIDNVVTGPNYT